MICLRFHKNTYLSVFKTGSRPFGLAKNHAFLDGNKRTAWSCCALFLKINGVEIAAPAMEAVETVVQLATGEVTEDVFAAWLRSTRR